MNQYQDTQQTSIKMIKEDWKIAIRAKVLKNQHLTTTYPNPQSTATWKKMGKVRKLGLWVPHTHTLSLTTRVWRLNESLPLASFICPHHYLFLTMRFCYLQVVQVLLLEKKAHIIKQPEIVNCFKCSLLMLHNVHSQHHCRIAYVGALCAMYQMLVVANMR